MVDKAVTNYNKKLNNPWRAPRRMTSARSKLFIKNLLGSNMPYAPKSRELRNFYNLVGKNDAGPRS